MPSARAQEPSIPFSNRGHQIFKILAIENWHPLIDCRETGAIEWYFTVVKALVSGQYTLDSWNPLHDCWKTWGNHYSGEGPGVTTGHAGSSSEFVFGEKSSHCLLSFSGESIATGLPAGDWPKRYCRHLTWDTRHPCYSADLEKKNPAGWNPLFEGRKTRVIGRVTHHCTMYSGCKSITPFVCGFEFRACESSSHVKFVRVLIVVNRSKPQ